MAVIPCAFWISCHLHHHDGDAFSPCAEDYSPLLPPQLAGHNWNFQVCYGNVPSFACDTTFTAAGTHHYSNNGAIAPLFTGKMAVGAGQEGAGSGSTLWLFQTILVLSYWMLQCCTHPTDLLHLLPEGSSKPWFRGPSRTLEVLAKLHYMVEPKHPSLVLYRKT